MDKILEHAVRYYRLILMDDNQLVLCYTGSILQRKHLFITIASAKNYVLSVLLFIGPTVIIIHANRVPTAGHFSSPSLSSLSIGMHCGNYACQTAT